MPKKARAEDEQKDELLRGVGDFLEQEGFSDLTMDKLSRFMGKSKKTLYRLFPSKEELIMAGIERALGAIRRFGLSKVERMEASDAGEYMAQLRLILNGFGELLTRIRPSLYGEFQSSHPHLAQRALKLRRELVLGLFSRIVRRGAELGLMRAEYPSELCAQFYANLLDGLLLDIGQVGRVSLSPQAYFQLAVDIVLQGMLSERGQEEYQGLAKPPARPQAKPRKPGRQ